MDNFDILIEKEVTQEKIKEIFDRALMKTTIHSDGSLVVKGDGPSTYITFEENSCLISFRSLFRLKEEFSLEAKHALINKINYNVILVRYCLSENCPYTMTADYSLSYEKAISVYQIVSSFRLFSKVSLGAIHHFDEEDIVK